MKNRVLHRKVVTCRIQDGKRRKRGTDTRETNDDEGNVAEVTRYLENDLQMRKASREKREREGEKEHPQPSATHNPSVSVKRAEQRRANNTDT